MRSYLHGALFALAGAANAVLSRLYHAPAYLAHHGMADLLLVLAVQLLVYFILGCALLAGLRQASRPPARLLQQPWRFVLLLTVYSALLSHLGWAMEHSIWSGSLVVLRQPLSGFVEGWLTIMLWGGLVGWLDLLDLQRRADQQRLDVMLAERAMLARRVAQAELYAARARVDPAAVAAELRAVRAAYAAHPAQGAALLDHLIGRLRQALRRGK
jgi:hypothetical protein